MVKNAPSFQDTPDFRKHLIYIRSLRDEKGRRVYTYQRLEEVFGVNRYYLWHIENDEKYVPPEWVQEELDIQKYELAPTCPTHGVVHCYDCETEQVKRKPKPRRKYLMWYRDPANYPGHEP